MKLELALLLVAMLAAFISGGTTRSLMRSYTIEEIVQSQSLFRRMMSWVIFLAFFAAIIWGFINLPWWQVLLSFLGASFIFIIIIRRVSLESWMVVEPIIQVVGVAATVYLWVGDFR